MSNYLHKLIGLNLEAIRASQGAMNDMLDGVKRNPDDGTIIPGDPVKPDFTDIETILTYQGLNVDATATVSFAGSSQSAEGKKLESASAAMR